jgi:hypothetical protein
LKLKYHGFLIEGMGLLATPSGCNGPPPLGVVHGKWVEAKDSHHGAHFRGGLGCAERDFGGGSEGLAEKGGLYLWSGKLHDETTGVVIWLLLDGWSWVSGCGCGRVVWWFGRVVEGIAPAAVVWGEGRWSLFTVRGGSEDGGVVER